MAASGFYDQSNANDTAVQSATLVNTDVQLKVFEKAQLQHQEELEQMIQSGA